MISIIIPIYNTAAYLAQCLDSLTSQTFGDWEAILVDDASTDNSLQIAQQYTAVDSRFKLICQSTNLGQAAARNRGLQAAQGEYIAFLDADDWWDNDYLEHCLSEIDGYDMLQTGYRRVKEGTVLQEKHPLHKWQFTVAWMRLYRKETIARLTFPEGTFYEDILWSVDLFVRNPKIKLSRYIGYNYRLTPGSTTSTYHKDDKNYILEQLRKRGCSPAVLFTRVKLSLFFLFH